MIKLDDLTSKVITNMGLREENLDPNSLLKISTNVKSAVLELRASGVLDEIIESDSGVTAIAIICNDLLNVDSGEIKISKAYMYHLPILQSLDLNDLEGFE